MAEVKIGDYLFQRLAQLKIKTVWGVLGDYELALLDLIGDAGLQFSGNANELIASYAAEGYARLNGIGAFVTTYGPGEISAYCGQAGSFAEFCPVVHIVGYPGVAAMKNHTLMHHSLGTGEFGMYHEMVKHISADSVVLTEVSTAAADIDRCLNNMLYQSQPVYIGVPVDMSHRLISADSLQTPLQTELSPNDEKLQKTVVDEILQRLEKSKYPVIILDGNAVRNHCVADADRLAEVTKMPYFTTCMGKGGPNEDLPSFGGVYQGAGSTLKIREAIEDRADCGLWLGSFRTDFNSGEFTQNIDESIIVDMQRFFTKIGETKHEVGIKGVLQALNQRIGENPPIVKQNQVDWDQYPTEGLSVTEELTQDYLWDSLAKLFQPGDVVVTETGTSAFGAAATRLPGGCLMYNQTIFGSIGYAGPSAAGAFQAAKENGKLKRGILLDHKPIVFVLNNNGYTVERLIHGKHASYNTLPIWDYKALGSVFGPSHPSKYHGPIKTCKQLEDLLSDESFQRAETFQLVELVLGELDAPRVVRLVTQAIEEFNQKHAAGSSMGA